jgi:hypothetical protein
MIECNSLNIIISLVELRHIACKYRILPIKMLLRISLTQVITYGHFRDKRQELAFSNHILVLISIGNMLYAFINLTCKILACLLFTIFGLAKSVFRLQFLWYVKLLYLISNFPKSSKSFILKHWISQYLFAL